ncbi:MAG: two-component regulator propeller domain-containing protein [Collimonas sp.]|uniref:sensor histidine kinase n=1 Tax=Collimonas sp. TaxID=1963772 RepID=UPI0032649FDF
MPYSDDTSSTMPKQSGLIKALRSWLGVIVFLCQIFLPMAGICQQLPLHYYDQADGLRNLGITALVRQASGYIWVGTENGLFRYDGARFQRFEISDEAGALYIAALHVDASDRLWIGTLKGLYLWQDQRLVPMQFQNAELAFHSGQVFAQLGPDRLLALSHDRIWQITSADGGVTWQAQQFFSAEELLQHPEMRALHSLHVGPKGDVWMGCDHSLCHYDQGKLVVLGKQDGLPAKQWKALLHDRQGTLWLRGENHVFALPADAKLFLDRSPPQGQQKKQERVPILAEDNNGMIFSQQDSGIIRWDGQNWRSFAEGNGLAVSDGISAILAGQNDGLWLGSTGHGLIHWLGYPDWENWTSQQGLPHNIVWSFLRDQAGRLHVGTRSGSAVLQKTGGFSILRGRYGGSSHEWISMIEDGKGRTWATTLSGILVRREPGATQDTVIAKLPVSNGMFFDRSGQLWLNTQRGLYVIRHPDASSLPLPVKEISLVTGAKDVNVFHGCQSTSGVFWFVSDKGLLRFDGKEWSNPRLAGNGSPRGELNTIACSSKGNLWLASLDAGLWRATEQDGTLAIRDITPAKLQKQSVLALLEDSRGWLWVATDAGTAVWNRNQWRFFNQQSGMVSNDSNTDALYEDGDGSIWVGTSGGASHILRPESLFLPLSLKLLVESIASDDRQLPLDKPVRLPWSSGALNFRFAALSYQNHEAIEFRYRMEGLEQKWSQTATPEVRYSALPPGRYRLQVTAENVAMQTSSPAVEMEIVILSPWWRTTIFYVVCGLLLLLALFLLERNRIRRLLARQRLKERLARERAYELELSREEERKHLTREIHDELGQYLSAMRMGVSVIGIEFGERNPGLQGKIQRQVTLVDSTIKIVRNIVSALRPGALDMGMVSALEWLVNEFSENTGVPCVLYVDEKTIVLDEKRATTFFRIVQESLTNIGRHAHASLVEIRLDRKDAQYLLEVRDNGRGFDPLLHKKKSFGLTCIRERAFMLDGSVDIVSVPGVGTTVRVQIPVDDAGRTR